MYFDSLLFFSALTRIRYWTRTRCWACVFATWTCTWTATTASGTCTSRRRRQVKVSCQDRNSPSGSLLLLFVQAMNHRKYFRIQLISIFCWSLKKVLGIFAECKPLFCHSSSEIAVNHVSARRRIRIIRFLKVYVRQKLIVQFRAIWCYLFQSSYVLRNSLHKLWRRHTGTDVHWGSSTYVFKHSALIKSLPVTTTQFIWEKKAMKWMPVSIPVPYSNNIFKLTGTVYSIPTGIYYTETCNTIVDVQRVYTAALYHQNSASAVGWCSPPSRQLV